MEPIKRARSDDLIEELHRKIIEIKSVEEELKSLKQDYEQYFKTFHGLEDPEKLYDDLKTKLINACSLAENDKEMIHLYETHNEIRQDYNRYN
ncbi:unnamed protein product [Blepharisma stoltei]|uniref:Uncharacterized protein n=1 Tax=Blepharisma stoltei TaxID=1481888 RepID=A0AAU9K3P8_9CILI|nr:unnamed protein product [Blepharisma stoltei]